MENKEYAFKGIVINGFLMLFVNAVVLMLSLVGIVYTVEKTVDKLVRPLVASL